MQQLSKARGAAADLMVNDISIDIAQRDPGMKAMRGLKLHAFLVPDGRESAVVHKEVDIHRSRHCAAGDANSGRIGANGLAIGQLLPLLRDLGDEVLHEEGLLSASVIKKTDVRQPVVELVGLGDFLSRVSVDKHGIGLMKASREPLHKAVPRVIATA